MKEAIKGHQRSSEVIRGHQRSSEVIRVTHLRRRAPRWLQRQASGLHQKNGRAESRATQRQSGGRADLTTEEWPPARRR